MAPTSNYRGGHTTFQALLSKPSSPGNQFPSISRLLKLLSLNFSLHLNQHSVLTPIFPSVLLSQVIFLIMYFLANILIRYHMYRVYNSNDIKEYTVSKYLLQLTSNLLGQLPLYWGNHCNQCLTNPDVNSTCELTYTCV